MSVLEYTPSPSVEPFLTSDKFQNFIVGFSVEYSSVNFALFARAADDYTLAELFNYRARDAGLAAEIFEV